ncbi:hypothetical protein LWI29_022412 [Acer saccharum]|uniref:F-box domain-containing protein n=1 Tax=Acer saccharum TaxID=4024 RepID=A0AA39RNH6_ACESA|nr:hypothetical protein LWI29_022412 [Acer saccharum]
MTTESINSIADFPEDLLVKIFDLLQSQSDVVRCKAVCKRWFSLISSPHFIHHSIHRHHHNNQIRSSFTFLVQPPHHRHKTTLFNTNFESKSKQQTHVVVVAYFNDLILCCETLFYQSVYYLCNPLTNQLFSLPPPPRRSRRDEEIKVGLICYPSPCNQTRQCFSTTNAEYTFKVVRIPRFVGSRKSFHVEIFCSETGEWSKSIVSSPDRRVSFFHRSDHMVPYKGILHWIDEDGEAIVAYDPLNDPKRCRIIDSPLYNGRDYVTVERLGVSGGRLRVLQFVNLFPFRQCLGSKLCVWEMEDYYSGKWGSPEDQVCLNEVVVPEEEEESCLAELMKGFQHRVSLLGLHPYDTDVVYLGLSGLVVICNVSTQTLRELCKADQLGMFGHGSRIGSVIPLVHPWWPTPVPPLPKSIEREMLQ